MAAIAYKFKTQIRKMYYSMELESKYIYFLKKKSEMRKIKHRKYQHNHEFTIYKNNNFIHCKQNIVCVENVEEK